MGGDEQAPLFSIGLIADPQYADLEDGDTEGRVQRYREAPAKLRAAVGDMLGTRAGRGWVADLAGRGLAAAVTLGDLVNGNSAAPERNGEELELIAGILDDLAPAPAYHVLGNHCLSVPRAAALERLGYPGGASYYSALLAPGWRLLALDTTEMSGHSGLPPGSEAEREAAAWAAAHPLGWTAPQASPWNGGASAVQLAWLRRELAAAEAAGERVLSASHHPVQPGAARSTHLAWNWEQISEVLLSSPAFAAHFSGHDHLGGWAPRDGRHFVTLEALLEAPPGSNAYAVLDVYEDRLLLRGVGAGGTCRICLEEDAAHNLEQPCSCSGSLASVHHACLQRWIDEKGDKRCEICCGALRGEHLLGIRPEGTGGPSGRPVVIRQAERGPPSAAAPAGPPGVSGKQFQEISASLLLLWLLARLLVLLVPVGWLVGGAARLLTRRRHMRTLTRDGGGRAGAAPWWRLADEGEGEGEEAEEVADDTRRRRERRAGGRREVELEGGLQARPAVAGAPGAAVAGDGPQG
eukprot:scaffold1.g5563.t1